MKSPVQAFCEIYPDLIVDIDILQKAINAAIEARAEIEHEVYRQMLNMPLMTEADLGAGPEVFNTHDDLHEMSILFYGTEAQRVDQRERWGGLAEYEIEHMIECIAKEVMDYVT